MSKHVGLHPDGSRCWTVGCKNMVPASFAAAAIKNKDFSAFIAAKETESNLPSEPHPDVVFSEILHTAQQNMESESYPEEYALNTKETLVKLYRKYGLPQVGRTRAVYKTGKGTVIKVSINSEGDFSSSREVRTSLEPDPYTPVAHCEWQTMNNIDILVMEEVTPVTGKGYSELPDWVGSVDCAQVGYTKSGKLVAYDL